MSPALTMQPGTECDVTKAKSSNKESQSIARRRGGAKVRTGCITCKTRRVKCDETKPHCLRCLRYWGSCDGYLTPSKRKRLYHETSSTQGAKLAVIAPAPGRDNARTWTTEPVIPRQLKIGPAFENAEEDSFFQVFLNITSLALTGAFDDPIWRYLLPQHSTNEPFVRYGTAALGALTAMFMEIMAKRRAGDSGDEDNCLGFSEIYGRAVTLYDKCLYHMRIALFKPKRSIRNSLIACLLVVCFEGLLGYTYSSAMHAQSGLDLFYSWFAGRKVHSADQTEVEDALVATMYRLDLQVLSFFDARPAQMHANIVEYETDVLESMPSTFISLKQARYYWDILSRRTYHFMALLLRSTGNTSPALMLESSRTPYPADMEPPAGVKIFAQCLTVPTENRTTHAKCTLELETWIRAYSPIYKHLNGTNNVQSRGAKILLIHAKTTRILLAGAFFKSEMEYDARLPEFQSIYTLAASLWSDHVIEPNVGVSYNFELGILAQLFLVVTRCRDHTLRYKIIDLLLTNFHRENCWDSWSVASIGRWVMSMEEGKQMPPIQGLQPRVAWSCQGTRLTEHANADVFIPEEKRVRILRFSVNLNLRRAKVEFVQGLADATGLQETTVKWW